MLRFMILKYRLALPDGDLAVKSIPPEDFFVDRSGRSGFRVLYLWSYVRYDYG